MVFFEAKDSSEMPKLCEPLFAKLDAAVEIQPAMTADDLKRGLS
jgi:hypothetical protein